MSEPWSEISLSQLATITMGQSPEASCVSTDERGLPFLQGCAEFGARVPSPKLHCSPPLRVGKAGSVLISVRAPVGMTNLADQDYCIGRGLGAVTARPEAADSIFLLHAIEQNVGFLHRRSQGSTFLAIGSRELSALPVSALPLEQQRRIAEILSTVDEAIEQTEALIAKYQQIKAGLMHDLFTCGLSPEASAKGDVTWTLRPTRAQAPHLYKESPLGWIPKEWEVSKLRDKSSPVKPHIKTGPFGSSLKGEHWVENGRPVITIGALGEGELLTEGLLFVSEATAHRLREYQLRPGDVVFSRVADVGRSAVICGEHDGWIMSSNLMRISLNQNLIVSGYLQAQFAFDHRVKAQIRVKVNSGGRDVANGQILNQLQFAWPRHEEQHVVLKRISALDAYRRNVIDQQTKLLKLKHGLMQDLLTGRVRVKVAEPMKGAV